MKGAKPESDPVVAPFLGFREWSRDEVNQTIAERFERQVERYRDRIAVRSASGSLSYRQLNRLANRLAHALLAQDPDPGQRVALLLDHDAPLIAAMLASLKAGKVCVVLTPAYPEARIGTILGKSGANLIVTDAMHRDRARIVARDQCPILDLGALPEDLSAQNPAVPIMPDALAFIVYTSGTSGQPRGVMQTHRNILHNIRRHTHGLKLHAGDIICLLATCSAGQGMATALGAVLNGATLCPRDLAKESVAGLAEWLVHERITVYISAATVFRHFARTLNATTRLPDIRMVRLASEPVRRSDFDLFKAHFEPHCICANTYSTSETGNLCQFFVTHGEELPGDVMPIGFPPQGVQIVLLDEQGQEAPTGEVGEIVVRSRYISPGYWNAPDETQAAFQSVPGSDERTYRTRDLARRHSDGRLEHLGRADTQVKIRGFRVYPDEVRNHLCRHPRVQDAVVDARTDNAGQARLIAYIIAAEDEAPSPKELRTFLKGFLPEFMVPNGYLLLDQFPATPNGKVDRDTLRALPIDSSGSTDAASRPRNELEQTLADIWTELLNLNHVGRRDNFFELGGDSLLVTQLVMRVGEVLCVDVPPSLVFEMPTIAELGAHIEQRPAGSGVAVPSITRARRVGRLPITGTQERIWRHSKTRRGNTSHLSANGYVLDGHLDIDALQRTFNEMIRRHEPFRTTYEPTATSIVQHIHSWAELPLRFVDLSADVDVDTRAMALWTEEASQPIDLEQGPIIRVVLIKISSTRHWLLTTIHHIVSDAWSRDNFLHEIAVLYAAYTSGRPAPLPDPGLHYADYAVWHKELLQTEGVVYREQLGYWKRQLAAPPRAMKFPFARRRLHRTTDNHDGRLRYSIAAELAASLNNIGYREGATLFVTRLTTFAMHLHQITGRTDFVVGSYMTNRSRPGTQNMIGLFANLVMLRLDLGGDPTFPELLRRSRRTTLEAVANSDLPFEELITALRRDKIRPPRIQVIFGLSYPILTVHLGNLELRHIQRPRVTTPWGFQVSVWNVSDAAQGHMFFDTRLFDPAGVRATMEQYQELMARIAQAPERRLSELCPIAPNGRSRFWPFG